ncbi:SusC/RagA family TonB-linked outer membrane protein [Puteibacter caeruleilacunae]|nr:SusC/RagA family TonB-linked outer membrane protein [Puteibacter caeruleilacunae]
MKITFCLIFVLATSVFATNVKSQNSRVSLNFNKGSIQSVIQEIENQADYLFVYNSREIDMDRKVTIKVNQRTVKDVLQEIFKDSGVDYVIEGTNIVLKRRLITAQQSSGKIVTGKVTDTGGQALPGVTITVLGETRGVITDIDGKFEISGINPSDKLVFSFIGMESQIVDVGSETKFKIKLKEKAEQLDDVTVVAFGKQKKESVLASVTTVNPGELKVPSSNLTTALAGRMAGIISYQRSGEPGQDNAEFFVRGVTTFGYKKDPLILIDGVELSAQDLARMQPDDIQSFSIMKDATATALYGARGANGVILVTTKEGKEGKARVSVRLENSFSTPTKDVKLADPLTYMRLHNEAVKTRDPLGVLPYSYDQIDQTELGAHPLKYPATDWQKMLFKDYTTNQRLNFNISGGGKVARYYIAGTASKDNGILKVDNKNNFNNNIDLRRYLVRSNININITKSTEAVVRLHATLDDYKGPIDGGTGVYNKVMRTNPVLFPAYYPADKDNIYTNHILFGNYEDANYINPYADMVKGYKDYSKTLVLAQFELKQDLKFITEGLSARMLASSNRYSYYDVSRYYNPYYYQIGAYDKKTGEYSLTQLNKDEGTEYLEYKPGGKDITSTSYLEAAVQYDRTFAEKHGVSGLLVYTLREQENANAGNLQKSLPYRNQGLSGRFTYSYDSRYFLEFNFGYNGSERFSDNERFGFFPSAGFGWILSNEKFFEPYTNVVSKLKFKATHGLVGNDAIGSADDRFYYLSNVEMNEGSKGYRFGTNFDYNKTGVSISRYADDNITWETAKKTNVGIELGLFEKLELQVDAFREHRTNILMDRASIPATMGLQAPVRANVGEALGKGVDLSLDYQLSLNQNFWLTARANFTYATSEFKVKEEVDYSATPWLSAIGQNLHQQWGFVAERLFVDDEEAANSPEQIDDYGAGDIKYKDLNNDGKITNLDKAPIGYPTTPEIVYGFGFSMGYKNFDFSCFFQGLARESFWIDAAGTAPFVDVDGDNNVISNNALMQAWADNHWTEETRDIYALWPRLSNDIVPNNNQRSTWFMRDGSFLRLKSAEFGYSIPKQKISKIGVDQCRIYLSGTNLLTFSKFKLWDPEMGSNGFGYPIQRVFNLGLQVSF